MDPRPTKSERKKEYYRTRRAKGLCTECDNPADLNDDGSPQAFCPECKARKRVYIQRSRERRTLTYQRRADEGRCVGCGKHPGVDGQTRCHACREKRREQDRQRRVRT